MAALDAFSNIWAAYSLRKLLTAYGGSAIRVRRSSDNAEQDIGFDVSGNLDTAALLSFVGAGNGFVVTWYDQTDARDVTQSSTSQQPRIVNGGVLDTVNNGRPALLCDGVDDVLGINAQPFAGTALSFLHVVKRNAGGTTYDTVWAREPTGDAGQIFNLTGGAFADWVGDDAIFLGDGFDTAQNPRFVGQGAYDLIDAQPVIWDGTLNPGTGVTLRKDGVAQTARSSSSGGGIVTGENRNWFVGGQSGSGENSWPGLLTELAVFDATQEANLSTYRADASAYWVDAIPVAARPRAFVTIIT